MNKKSLKDSINARNPNQANKKPSIVSPPIGKTPLLGKIGTAESKKEASTAPKMEQKAASVPTSYSPDSPSNFGSPTNSTKVPERPEETLRNLSPLPI